MHHQARKKSSVSYHRMMHGHDTLSAPATPTSVQTDLYASGSSKLSSLRGDWIVIQRLSIYVCLCRRVYSMLISLLSLLAVPITMFPCFCCSSRTLHTVRDSPVLEQNLPPFPTCQRQYPRHLENVNENHKWHSMVSSDISIN